MFLYAKVLNGYKFLSQLKSIFDSFLNIFGKVILVILVNLMHITLLLLLLLLLLSLLLLLFLLSLLLLSLLIVLLTLLYNRDSGGIRTVFIIFQVNPETQNL